jgi:hypothetical protein
MFSKIELATAALLLCASVGAAPMQAAPMGGNGTASGGGGLPVIDLGYSLHQAAYLNVSQLPFLIT